MDFNVLYSKLTSGLNSVHREVITRIVKADIFSPSRPAAEYPPALHPRQTQRPIIKYRMRRKYSWRVQDKKLRLSVSMPTKRLSRPKLRQLGHLTFHAVFLIVEPPAGTELHLARHPSPGSYRLSPSTSVIARVQAVKNGFRQQVFFILLAQQSGQLFRHRAIVDGIKANIRP